MWTGCKKCVWLFDLLIFILTFLYWPMRLVQVIVSDNDAKFPQWNPKVMIDCSFDFKVHIFWAATKFFEIFPLILIVCTVVKSKGKISQNFVAFSENMNFNTRILTCKLLLPVGIWRKSTMVNIKCKRTLTQVYLTYFDFCIAWRLMYYLSQKSCLKSWALLVSSTKTTYITVPTPRSHFISGLKSRHRVLKLTFFP